MMATEIQTLQPKETLDITQKQGGWLSAMTELATSPNAIANLGVQMASDSSKAYQRLQGVEAGKTPSNNLLPPITNADKAFVEGYSAQAEQTLGLQAQQLMSQAQLDLNKNYKLSNSSIQAYSENVSKGLGKIIEQAPYTIKDKLANQYSDSLQRTTFDLNNRLLTQQKQESKENAGLYIKNQMSQMTDAILTGQGNPNTVYQNSIDYINKKQASGMWSPTEAESQRQAMKQMYLNNVLSKGAIDSYKNKDLEQYLNSLTEKPSKFGDLNVSYDEWETARNHALNEITNYERFTSGQQNLEVSDAKIKFLENKLEQTDIDTLKQDLQPQKFNEFYAWLFNAQSKYANKKGKTAYYYANNTNVDIMAQATPDEVDNTYDYTVAQVTGNAAALGKSLTKEDAQFMAVATIPRPIPVVNKMLAGELANGDAMTAIKAASQIKRIQDADLGSRLNDSLTNLNSPSARMAHALNELVPFARSPDEAVNMARQIAFPTTEQKNAALKLSQEHKKKYGKTDKKIDYAMSNFTIPNKSLIQDKANFYLNVDDAFSEALEYFGNENMAQTWVQKGLDQNYGISKVNGYEQYVLAPLEKLTGIDEKGVPVIQQDIYDSVTKYVANQKAIYDNNKNLGFYYELAPRKNYDEFAQAVLDPKTPNAKETIDEFLAAKPIQITKVFRNGDRQDFTLEVRPGPYASLASNADVMASGYDYILRNKNGAVESFHGTFNEQGRIPAYSPRTKFIKDASMTIQQAYKGSWEMRLKSYLDEHKGAKQRLISAGQIPGQGFAGLKQTSSRDEMELAKLGE